MSELKACPFCGGKAKIMQAHNPYVICGSCHVSTPMFSWKADAVNAWTRRAEVSLEPEAEAPWNPDRNRYCCSKCGAYVGKYDKFCPGCGAKLTDWTEQGRGKHK